MKVPYWQECKWSCKVKRKVSLNWKVQGNCCISCQVASSSWVKIGEISLLSVWMWPQRSENLCPKANQSFSMRAWNSSLRLGDTFNILPNNLIACDGPVKRINQQRRQGTNLRSTIPPIWAMHHHTDSLLQSFSDELGRVQDRLNVTQPTARLQTAQEAVHRRISLFAS